VQAQPLCVNPGLILHSTTDNKVVVAIVSRRLALGVRHALRVVRWGPPERQTFCPPWGIGPAIEDVK
jgi:hypothetical protein